MRLIDAEATKEKLFVELKGLEPIPEDIDEMPAIEAIPVEWIDQYIADETNGRKSEMQPIGRMLEAWREEQC